MHFNIMKTFICVILCFIGCLYVGYSKKLLYEGDSCVTINKESGICVRLEFCRQAKKLLEKNVHPVNCGFLRSIPVVCCPKNETKFANMAESKCAFYNSLKSHVIFGQNAAYKEFTHMASLGYTDQNKKKWLCGGSLISENFVLTAAHCLNSFEFGPVKWVRIDIIDINEPEFNNLVAIKRIPHPLYSPPLVYHDIGLVQLDKFIRIGPNRKPACLYQQDTIPEGTELFATGWGITKVGGTQSRILQKVSLDLFNEEECDLSYNKSSLKRKLKYGIVHEQQICAGGKTIGTDTCQGDSGGPLKTSFKVGYENVKIWDIIGVTSFGKSCGFVNVPGIYTRVSYYVPWIESIIWSKEAYNQSWESYYQNFLDRYH